MIDEKAEKILYRLKADLLISLNEFEYLIELLKNTGKGSVVLTNLDAIPRGYEAWRENHTAIDPLPEGFKLEKSSEYGLNIAVPIPQSKL